jgi:hypothetical protein
MSLSKYDRYVYLCELRIRSSPKNAPSIDINEIYSYLEKKEKFLLLKIQQDLVTIVLKEFKLTKTHAIFLFHLRNENIADQIQQNKKTGKARAFDRQIDEAPAMSAHMAVSLDPTEANGDTYTALIENVPMIGRTLIIGYLKKLFELHFTKTVPKEHDPKKTKNNSDELKKYKPYPELFGHKSNTLQDALKKGAVFEELSLSRTDVSKGVLGDAPFVQEKDFKLVLKMKPELTGKNGILALKTLTEKFRKDYDSAKVKITPQSGRSKVTPLDMEKENVAHQVCIFQEEVSGFKTPLAVCEEKIRMDLIERMIQCTPK